MPSRRVKDFLPAEDLAKTLTDAELVERCMQGFRKLKEIVPYLREARERFAKPGRRVPVAGNPTWTEWVTQNLGVTIRTVQRLLQERKPHDKTSLGQGAHSLSEGDWRGLLAATERSIAQVFGPLEDDRKLALSIRRFAQAIADRHARRGSKLVVSVSIG